MQEVELFFNAGDIARQSNWLIYPKSLDSSEMKELTDIVFGPIEDDFKDIFVLFEQIEKRIERERTYPDPLKLKSTSKWYYHQLRDGAIIYRYAVDGRRESDSRRINSSVEGAYLKGVDLNKSVKKYRKRGIDIVDEIGKQLPRDIEKLLVSANFDLFKTLFRDYSNEGKLASLYNHFYVACYGSEITTAIAIDVPPLCTKRLFDKTIK